MTDSISWSDADRMSDFIDDDVTDEDVIAELLRGRFRKWGDDQVEGFAQRIAEVRSEDAPTSGTIGGGDIGTGRSDTPAPPEPGRSDGAPGGGVAGPGSDTWQETEDGRVIPSPDAEPGDGQVLIGDATATESTPSKAGELTGEARERVEREKFQVRQKPGGADGSYVTINAKGTPVNPDEAEFAVDENGALRVHKESKPDIAHYWHTLYEADEW